MHILLVEPDYYTKYPPLGLLKLSTYHKKHGNEVQLVKGKVSVGFKPDKVFVTSLFTYSWKPVHDAVKYYKLMYPWAKIELGGIYASLMPQHAAASGADRIHVGLFEEAESLMPDYSLVPEWDGSILFSSRGCIRRCSYCAVPILEGGINSIKHSIKHIIYPGHTKVILWDNNILGAGNWRRIFEELLELGLKVDFNQGLDARLVTRKIASELASLKTDIIRMAYDHKGMGKHVRRAIKYLNEAGIRGRKILVYALFNYKDSPEDFYHRVRDLLEWGVVCYPMRFQPINSLEKNRYVAPKWTPELLEMIADARRVLGYSGAFPPYEGLRQKFLKVNSFEEAFKLRPPKKMNKFSKGYAKLDKYCEKS